MRIRAAQPVSKVVVTWQESASKSATNHTAIRCGEIRSAPFATTVRRITSASCARRFADFAQQADLLNPKNGSKLPSRDFANPPNRYAALLRWKETADINQTFWKWKVNNELASEPTQIKLWIWNRNSKDKQMWITLRKTEGGKFFVFYFEFLMEKHNSDDKQ